MRIIYINIYIKLLEPGDKIAGNGGGAGVDNQEGGATSGDRATGPTITAATSGTVGHQGDQWRAAGLWYLVADEGGGLLPGMIPRPLWRDRRPVGHQTGAGEGQRLGGISPQSRRGDGEGRGATVWRRALAPVYGNFGYCFEK